MKDYFDCVNPKRKTGQIYENKDTWEKRAGKIKKLTEEIDDA